MYGNFHKLSDLSQISPKCSCPLQLSELTHITKQLAKCDTMNLRFLAAGIH